MRLALKKTRTICLLVFVLFLLNFTFTMVFWQFKRTEFQEYSKRMYAREFFGLDGWTNNSRLSMMAWHFSTTQRLDVSTTPRDSSLNASARQLAISRTPAVQDATKKADVETASLAAERTFLLEPSKNSLANTLTFTSDDLTCKNVPLGIHETRWNLVVFVKSKASYRERRHTVRTTWGKFRIINGVRVEKVFVIGVTDHQQTMAALKEESKQYGDILQFDGPDDYRNMPSKVSSAMQWAANNLPSHYIYASTDDDFLVNYDEMLTLMEAKMRSLDPNAAAKNFTHSLLSSPIFCVYDPAKKVKPIRNKGSKYYISEEEFAGDVYPPFCGGGFYTMPVSLLRDIYRLSRQSKPLPMDDVWVTGILRRKLDRGDSNIDVIQSHPVPKLKTIWKHFWGDYGKKEKDIPAMLKAAWRLWEMKIVSKSFCIR